MVDLPVFRIIRNSGKSPVIFYLPDHKKDIFVFRAFPVFSFHIPDRCFYHGLLFFFRQNLIRSKMINLTEHSIINAVECPEGHRTMFQSHPGKETLFHFLYRILGEGNNQYLLRPDPEMADHPFQTSRNHSRLSGTRSCKDHTWSFTVADRLPLCLIKIGKRGSFSPAV